LKHSKGIGASHPLLDRIGLAIRRGALIVISSCDIKDMYWIAPIEIEKSSKVRLAVE